MNDTQLWFLCVSAATLIALVYHATRERRRKLAEFERLVVEAAKVEASVTYDDTAPTETDWGMVGTIGERKFVFTAKEHRGETRRHVVYTLTLDPKDARSPGYQYGGDASQSEEDQPLLSALFGRLWPATIYPRPLPV